MFYFICLASFCALWLELGLATGLGLGLELPLGYVRLALHATVYVIWLCT